MSQATQGDRVTVEYTGTLEDGTVFDSSRERKPIEFVIGENQVIPGFESAVMGMEPGESRTATLSPEDGYGERSDDRVFTVPRGDLPDDVEPSVGDRLEVRQQNGNTFPVTVMATDGDQVTLDANHPLAGKQLTFEIELVSIS